MIITFAIYYFFHEAPSRPPPANCNVTLDDDFFIFCDIYQLPQDYWHGNPFEYEIYWMLTEDIMVLYEEDTGVLNETELER